MVWKILAAVAAVLLLLMLYGMYLESTPQGAEKIRAREAIAACRADEADPLAELADRRRVRQVCDEMESRFIARYGHAP